MTKREELQLEAIKNIMAEDKGKKKIIPAGKGYSGISSALNSKSHINNK